MLRADRIAERRLALGQSQPRLARSLGVSPPVIERLEQGESDADQPLGFLQRLAEALGVAPSYLVSEESERQVRPTKDDVKVEAALEMLAKQTPITVLAEGFCWDIPRARTAVGTLKARLRPTGRTIRYSGGKVGLAPAIEKLSDEEIERLELASVRETRLSVADARVLRQVADGAATARWLSEASETEKNAAARLRRLGWAEPRGSRVVMSGETEWNLDPERECPISTPSRQELEPK